MPEGNMTITMTTDFGTKDPWVGSMKGVGMFLNPNVNLIDITHEVEPGNIFEAAFILANTAGAFPKGTIHVAVVDPGVGGDRDPIVILTDNHFFVGPDNGVLSLATQNTNVRRVIKITNDDFFQKPVSSTFHGRDIFMPSAAYITRGVSLDDLGEEVSDYKKIDYPKAVKEETSVTGEVIYVDNFGNLITNIKEDSISHLVDAGKIETEIKCLTIDDILDSYSDRGREVPVAIMGSLGFLEIACYKGRANELTEASVGESVTVKLKK